MEKKPNSTDISSDKQMESHSKNVHIAKKGNFKGETKSFLIAAQNNVISKQENTRRNKIAGIDYVVTETEQTLTK